MREVQGQSRGPSGLGGPACRDVRYVVKSLGPRYTVFFRCSLAIRPLTASQPIVSATLRYAKAGAPAPIDVPSRTKPAERTSPVRMKNVSTAALALYFASREVGSHSAWRTVFWIE